MKTLLTTLALAAASYASAQTVTVLYSQDFENTNGIVPAEVQGGGDDDTCSINPPLFIYDSWGLTQGAGGSQDSAMIVMSLFNTNPCQADDWMLVGPFTITDTTTFWSWSMSSNVDTSIKESFEIIVGSSNDFNVLRTQSPLYYTTDFASVSKSYDTISLSMYKDSTVYVAYHYFSVNKSALGIDDLSLFSRPEVVGVNNFADIQFSIFPNPAREVLNIRLGQWEENSWAELTDMAGRVILQQQLNEETTALDVRDLNTGLYALRVRTPRGIRTEKVQIRR